MSVMRRLASALLALTLAQASLGAAGKTEALYAVQPPIGLAAASAALPQAESAAYVVQKGDSLSRIAARFGVTVDDLITANNLTTTVIQPGQVLIIPGATAAEAASDSVYSRIQGSPTFIQYIRAALDWMQANDPDAYARVDGYVTVITPSTFAHFATARPLPGGGCAVQALARRSMSVELTAALLYHEASHCYQFATIGILPNKDAEIYAYTEQIDFMERHGFPPDEIEYYKEVLAYYQSQPDDGKYVKPPNF
jgi:LysM repeat protein